MKATFDSYDERIEKFENIKGFEYWPTNEQLEMFENDPDKWIRFCIYLYEHNPEPTNSTERYSKKNLNAFINRHLELTE